MKKLTAIFLEALGKETGQRDRAAALASKSMQEEFARKTAELLSAGTLFFSDQGRELRQNLIMLRDGKHRSRSTDRAILTPGSCTSFTEASSRKRWRSWNSITARSSTASSHWAEEALF